MRLLRLLIGTILLALGVGGLVIDYHVIHVAKGGELHAINAIVELALIASGIIALLPTLALEIAKDLPLFGKAVTAVWPGGRRESDPPLPPPPPGVANVQPPHVAEMELPPRESEQ